MSNEINKVNSQSLAGFLSGYRVGNVPVRTVVNWRSLYNDSLDLLIEAKKIECDSSLIRELDGAIYTLPNDSRSDAERASLFLENLELLVKEIDFAVVVNSSFFRSLQEVIVGFLRIAKEIKDPKILERAIRLGDLVAAA